MQIPKGTLTSVHQSKLAVMFSGAAPLNKDKDGRIFIDRNPQIFAQIIDYLGKNRE